MANKTVYPYGTDGQLPSGIGLVNDLYTGGVDQALTAEQGKVIGEMLGGVEVPVTVALEAGGIYAESSYNYYGQASSTANLTRSDYVECAGFAYLKYTKMLFSSTSNNVRFGLVFYDENKVAIAGYPSERASSAAGVTTTVEVPSNAAYFRMSYWANNTSRTVYLITPSKLEKKELINVLGAKFYAQFTSDDYVDFGFASLNSGGFYAVSNGSQDSRIILDLRSRDYSKEYRISWKYTCAGCNSSKFWCVYTNTQRQSDNEGVVFSGGLISNGDGVISAIVPKNNLSKNYIRLSSQSGSGMPNGATALFYDFQIEEIDGDGGGGGSTPSGTQYDGPLVKVEPQHYVSKAKVSTITSVSCQGGACYGDYLFMFANYNTTCWIYNLATSSLVQTITIPSGERGFVSDCHANTVNFGKVFYDANDPFPLLYVSTGYASDGYTGALVYRVVATTTTENEVETTTYSLTLVQTLKMVSSTETGSWTEFVVGDDNDCYLCYTAKRRIYRMVMPSLSDGDITFDLDNALEVYQFTPQPESWLGSDNQNRMYYNGKIYMVSGVPSRSQKILFVVLDLATRKREVVIDLESIGLTGEPETCFIWRGMFCIVRISNADVYALSFD